MTAASPQTPRPPAIVLVQPQLGENVGTAIRAMANFGLTELRLVRPREAWPNDKGIAAASGADRALDRIETFDSVRDAIADLGFVYATTARAREVLKPVVGPRVAADNVRRLADAGTRSGILFGPERTGLNNEDLSLADEILTYPVDPGFASINLAQAVLLFGYEGWPASRARPRRCRSPTRDRRRHRARTSSGSSTTSKRRSRPPTSSARRRSARTRPRRSARCSSAPASRSRRCARFAAS